MSLLRLGNKKTVAYLLAFLLLFSFKSLTLIEVSCKVRGSPGERPTGVSLEADFRGLPKPRQ